MMVGGSVRFGRDLFSDFQFLGLRTPLDAEDITWVHPWYLDLFRAFRHRTTRYCFYFHKQSKPKLVAGDRVWWCCISWNFLLICVQGMAVVSDPAQGLLHPMNSSNGPLRTTNQGSSNGSGNLAFCNTSVLRNRHGT